MKENIKLGKMGRKEGIQERKTMRGNKRTQENGEDGS